MNTETPQESSIDKVSAALVAAQGELEAATFDSTNPFLKNSYASLGAVIETSRPVLAKHGLAILQTPRTNDGHISVTTQVIHQSGQWLDGGTMSLPMGEERGKSLAQVAGSIITYLRRYAWASVLGMYAEQDTDGNEPEQRKGAMPRQNAPQRTEPPKPPQGTTQEVKTPSSPSSEPPKPLLATPQQRMKALNQLKAAPGQEHRVPFTHYLESKKWISYDQLAEDWPLEHVPTTQKGFIALAGELDQFLRDMAAEASK